MFLKVLFRNKTYTQKIQITNAIKYIFISLIINRKNKQIYKFKPKVQH